jgi:hypothetical protein
MNVCGIDYSVHAVDLVLLDEETPAATWERIHLEEGEGAFVAARSLRGRFPGRSWFEEQGVYLVGLEEPFSSNFAGTAKALGTIAGALAVLLPPGLTVLRLPTQEWKRETIGKANATKEDVAVWAAMTWNPPDQRPRPTQDAYDAYGIAYAARAINQRAIERGAA